MTVITAGLSVLQLFKKWTKKGCPENGISGTCLLIYIIKPAGRQAPRG
jgi:hypothetical protein